jgi:molybdate transport system substrate-binding protein
MIRVVGAIVIVALLGGCSATSSSRPGQSGASTVTPGSNAGAVELMVYGASSLKVALDAIKTAYATVAPGVTLTIATGASSTLRSQIEQGGPADVFLSADRSNPKALVDAGLADGTAVDFAGNRLTVIIPTADPAGIATPADLARAGTKVIAAGTDVPITNYATEVVAKLATQPGYPTGFAAAYDANVVSREDNVKAVVAKVELGEGDAAIVYVTDAKASTRIKTIEIPPAADVPTTYAGLVVKRTAHATAAHAFLTWLTGSDGQKVLAGFGFMPPS